MCERVGFWTVQEQVMCFIEFVDDDAGGGGNLGIFCILSSRGFFSFCFRRLVLKKPGGVETNEYA